MRVNSIEKSKILDDIKASPQSVQEYIRALENAIERWKFVTAEATKRIRELSCETSHIEQGSDQES